MDSEVTLCTIFKFFSLCFYFSTVVQIVYIIIICVHMHTLTHVPQLSGTKSKETFTQIFITLHTTLIKKILAIHETGQINICEFL